MTASNRPAFRNFLLNALGNAAPALIALIAVPVIAHHAGTARLGFLGLAWTLIGYLGLLDLGLARVVARRVAQAATAEQFAIERALVWRICLLLFAVAVVLSVLLAWVPVQAIIGKATAADLVLEAQSALRIVLLTLPLVVVTGVLRGVLEGRQQFGVSNLLKIIFGALSFLAPTLIVLGWPTLPALVAGIALSRVLAFVAHAWAASRALPGRGAHHASLPLRPLLIEGGWYTVTSVVGPLMVNFDRFAVTALCALTAAAYYIVPQDVVLRMLLLPAALASTIFPVLAQAHGQADATRQHDVGERSFVAALALALPMSLALAVLAEPALRLWMGEAFAQGSAGVTAIFAVGLLANSVAQVPYAALQAAGRADLTGKLHLTELPFYMAVMLPMTLSWGLPGAALAWSLRALIDAWALLWLAGRHGHMRAVGREAVSLLGCALLVAAGGGLVHLATGPLRLGLIAVFGLAGVALVWRWAARLGLLPSLVRRAFRG